MNLDQKAGVRALVAVGTPRSPRTVSQPVGQTGTQAGWLAGRQAGREEEIKRESSGPVVRSRYGVKVAAPAAAAAAAAI